MKNNVIDFIKSSQEGRLPDGRILVYKYKISKDLVEFSRKLVALANSGDGLVYGVKEYKYMPVIKGVADDFDSFRDLVFLVIKGIYYRSRGNCFLAFSIDDLPGSSNIIID